MRVPPIGGASEDNGTAADLPSRETGDDDDMRKIILGMLIALASVSLLAACSTNRPVDEQLDDAGITAAINAKLAEDTDVSMFAIDVDTMDGVVTLSGTVDSDEARREAERIARSQGGVTRVVSRIRVE
ncbi:MAG TPA: BON domain-containing protein [Thermoanaerobaculia bacterium]|nr:BON domain-containing protein [Thermoanaerobaculia bacterium]